VRRISALCVLVWVAVIVPAYGQNTTTRVSVPSGGGLANNFSDVPAISTDGRYVVFSSRASNLAAADTNGVDDVFVHDVLTGTTERVSVATGGAEGNGFSREGSISANGRFVAFVSAATNLVPDDTNNQSDVFVRDRQSATTSRVSVGPGGVQGNFGAIQAVISANGRYVAFVGSSNNLVANDTNSLLDIFRFDRDTSETIRINVSTGGGQAVGGHTFRPSISADGSFVAFDTEATNMISGDTNGLADVFVRDVQANTTTRVSVGPGGVQGNNVSNSPSISADGRFVSFSSASTNFASNGHIGIFVRDRQNPATTSPVAVVDSNATQGRPIRSMISGDGAFVCFDTVQNPTSQITLVKRETLAKTLLSVAPNGDPANGSAIECMVNGDGSVTAFRTVASNLVPGDTNNQVDVFVRKIPGNSTASMALDKTALSFGAVTSGGTFAAQTAAQVVRLTQTGTATVTWSAVSNQPWLKVSPASGSGSAALSISVEPAAGLPPSGTVTGTIALSVIGATTPVPPIIVSLTLVPSGTSVAPFGTVDTPTDNRTGVAGAVPFTGWALDDIEVARVSICRDAFGAEVAPVDPNCGGVAGIFVGFAVFIDGARPDVAAAFPSYPLVTRAGWGFMVLTNFLPNQGNGTYRFTMRAQDREGHWFVLGSRTMTCANASATLPFGTLDTPEQGGLPVSGGSFINFGWALTPQPKTIPIDGSTIHVLVDGVDIGTADYNHPRPDIQALFPGYNNTNGAIGFRIFDTTTLANGLHTISWVVSDNQGATEGLGSRFFTVSNGVGAVTAAATSARSRDDVEALSLETTPVAGRRGWDLEAPFGLFGAGATGVTVIRSEEVSRVELQLGDGTYSGYLRTPAGLTSLPVGSRLDTATNTFTWAPGVGFVGRYDFVFVRSLNRSAVSRRDVRIILHPKGRGAVGPQVVIDAPRSHAQVQQPFMVGGWAVDLDAAEGTGVTTVHAWAFPTAGGAPIFLGATAYGGTRPDVAAVHGDRFKDSGFSLIAQGLPAGDYDFALFAWSTEAIGFVAPKFVRINVLP
jgi:hypothetical protein